jgi:threonine synthase
VVAQAERANPLYVAYRRGWVFEPVQAQPTLATAIQIGNPVSIEKAVRTLRRHDGIVEQASEAELADAAAVADRAGLFTCPHTGVALAALRKLVERREIGPRERVVVISTANGLKFAEFKQRYHEGTLPFDAVLANPPVNLADDYDEVRRAIDRFKPHARADDDRRKDE